ncbi:hypothetical protein [Chromobacterium piscinae]|uniref:hypothetical protein n=1 Tax=Chromobacterium piscinae TaxID=686831 RepID=UPI003F7F692A
MNDKLLASFKKLVERSSQADAQLEKSTTQFVEAFEEKIKSHATEESRIKERISRGSRISKHRFTI